MRVTATKLEDEAIPFFQELQDRIVADLQALDGQPFHEDAWQRPGGGGGRSRVIVDGNLFEQAGVNFSDVSGTMRPELATSMPGEGTDFRAAGISLVLHPRSPRVPTVHANLRFIRKGDAAWFGGGTDLTPYYVVPEDARAFHCGLKTICDRHDESLFPRFKRWCDHYFFLPHRKEARGVGGIFFDHLGAGAEAITGEPSPALPRAWEMRPADVFAFVRDLGEHMLEPYIAIARRRRDEAWGEREREWQLLRRGRYVEFNLVYDRGTLFGLRTDGRTESILMSLPPQVKWRYGFAPEPNSPEAESLAAICAQRDWAADSALP